MKTSEQRSHEIHSQSGPIDLEALLSETRQSTGVIPTSSRQIDTDGEIQTEVLAKILEEEILTRLHEFSQSSEGLQQIIFFLIFSHYEQLKRHESREKSHYVLGVTALAFYAIFGAYGLHLFVDAISQNNTRLVEIGIWIAILCTQEKLREAFINSADKLSPVFDDLLSRLIKQHSKERDDFRVFLLSLFPTEDRAQWVSLILELDLTKILSQLDQYASDKELVNKEESDEEKKKTDSHLAHISPEVAARISDLINY